MKVPLLDLKAQYATIREEVLAAATEVLDSQVCIGGPKIAELERRVAEISGSKHGVGVSSGTDALLLSLMALGIGPGDEVITTPFTFFATAGSIVRTGATPVFVDIDPRTYNIEPRLIEAAISPRTRAIMPVHLYGQVCDMDPVLKIAERHGLYVIEDAAQSIGAQYKGRRAGSMGTVGCFSFFPSKNLGAAGDGGMVVTSDDELAERMRMMRNHGASPKYFHKVVGGNFRLDPLQAAILLVKLPHLEEWSEARRRNAEFYDRAFAVNTVSGSAVGTASITASITPRISPWTTPWISPDCVSIYNQYVIRVKGRDKDGNDKNGRDRNARDRLMVELKDAGIGTEVYYPRALHEQECFAYLGYKASDCPEASRAAGEVLALPIYPELTEEMMRAVVDGVMGFRADRTLEADRCVVA
jgi:dTDP-4-amino-4,6-dideoxygalactose transaminase